VTDDVAMGDSPSSCPRVLLVDDNALFLRVLATVLEEASPAFEIHGVTTGGAALAYLCGDGVPASEAPDFIVLDFHLPDMDAPEVLQRLRSSSRAGDIPVLVLTQAYWAEDENAALSAGATVLRAKPSSLAELRRMVVEFWTEVDAKRRSSMRRSKPSVHGLPTRYRMW
jgi:CheY-like chemotaxis protein